MFKVNPCLIWQIEHHLFPGVGSDRLAVFVPIVEETCKYVPKYA
jgi:fatty acid desaturase